MNQGLSCTRPSGSTQSAAKAPSGLVRNAQRKKRITRMAKATANAENSRSLEATLWAAADKLRGTLDAAEYKHVVLGLIFLKYISDAFTERRAELDRLSRDPDSDFYVPDEEQRAAL